MRRIGLLALFVALVTTGLTAAESAAATGDPVGVIDVVTRGAGTITVSGWAADRDAAGPISVHVYVDGRIAGGVEASAPRPDVRAATGLGSNTGYQVTVPAGASGEVCVFGIDVGPGSNTRLACRRFGSTTPASSGGAASTPGFPFGTIDQIDGVAGGPIVVHGWSLDPDTDSSIDVHVYVDGQGLWAATASLDRPDVAVAFGKGPAHGYRVSLVAPAGARRVCVYGIDASGRGPNPIVACRDLVGGAPAPVSGNRLPIGAIDTVAVSGDRLAVHGWALDPDANDAIAVHAYIDGAFAGAGVANLDRPDVGAVHGRGNLHGYRLDLPTSSGPHTVCVFGIDASGGPNPAIACRSYFSGPPTGGGPGAVLTPTGLLLPVIGGAPGGWLVRTTCFNEATISQGTFIPTVDFLIDPGHGGSESGSVGSNGLIEKRLNLEIANRLAAILRAQGYSVALTRTNDIRIPLVTRAVLAESLRPRAFLSVHHNGGSPGSRSAPAPEVYYKHDSAEARRLAGILYQELREALSQYSVGWVGTGKGATSRLREDGDDLYGLHRNSGEVVSVITEALYLSNPAEAALIAQASVQQVEAQALADGLNRWLTTADAGGGYTPHFTDPTSTGTGGTEGCVDPPLQ